MVLECLKNLKAFLFYKRRAEKQPIPTGKHVKMDIASCSVIYLYKAVIRHMI